MDPVRSVVKLPARVVLASLAITLAMLVALAVAYMVTGESGVLMAILLIGLLAPIDSIILYTIFKNNSTAMIEAINLIKSTSPTILMAPLGIKLIASWHSSGEARLLTYTGSTIRILRIGPARIGGTRRPSLHALLRIPGTPPKPGKCRWASWRGRARTLIPTAGGMLAEAEGPAEGWAMECSGRSPVEVVEEALERLGIRQV